MISRVFTPLAPLLVATAYVALRTALRRVCDIWCPPPVAATGERDDSRGVSKGMGSFSVTAHQDQLLVFHGSLGSVRYPMRRQAPVVQLEEPPSEVFVTCSMAK